jgi:hypothetical protein
MSKPKKVSRTQQHISLHVSLSGRDQDCITPDVLDRFIESVNTEGEIDRDAAEQVAILLRAFRDGAKYGDNMTKELRSVFGFTRNRSNKYNTAPLDKKLKILNIVKAYSEGTMKHLEAYEEIMELLGIEREWAEKLVVKLKPIVQWEIQSVSADINIEEWNNTDHSQDYEYYHPQDHEYYEPD